MPDTKAILDTDQLRIGWRLRLFREFRRISRTAFALSVGIGGERLASYEAGRSPLKYFVFREIAKTHFLDPLWLATSQGGPISSTPFDDSSFIASVKRTASFMEVFGAHLRQPFLERIQRDQDAMILATNNLHEAAALLADPAIRKKIPAQVLRALRYALPFCIAKMSESSRMRQDLNDAAMRFLQEASQRNTGKGGS